MTQYANLGSGTQGGLDAALSTIERIEANIERRLTARVDKAVGEALARYQPQRPEVHVAAPHVNVASPPATPPAQVTVQVPDSLPPDVNVEVMGLEGLVALQREQATTNELLRQVLVALSKPVTREVQRDNRGLIETMTERRA